jgi:hypothetical protein
VGFHVNVMSHILEVCDIADRWQHGRATIGMSACWLKEGIEGTNRIGKSSGLRCQGMKSKPRGLVAMVTEQQPASSPGMQSSRTN